MAHKLNINFYLYTALDESAANCYEAVNVLNNSGIQFTHIHYYDLAQSKEVLESLRTWDFSDLEEKLPTHYPFVIYEQAFDITDNPPRKPVLVHGIDAIKNTDWNTLVNFKG